MFTDQEIDEAVLAQCDASYRKVALIIVRASKTLGQDGDEFYERVGKRVHSLADDGQLEGTGDLSDWRHSEVRLPRG